MSDIEEITTAELLQAAIDSRLVYLHVAMPAKVESYSSPAQTVDVVLQLNRSLPDGAGNYVTEKLPKLQAIPVVFPRCGSFGVTFPIAAGDFGLVVVCERNIGVWRATAAQGDPGDLGMHTLDGAVFIPGLFPDSKPAQSASANDMVIGSDTAAAAQIVIKSSGEVDVGSGATNFVAMADKVKTWLDAFVTAVNGWTPVPNDGGAALKAALATILGGVPSRNVASSNLKAND